MTSTFGGVLSNKWPIFTPVDSYGNVHRSPAIAERNRTGGAGVYYHVCGSVTRILSLLTSDLRADRLCWGTDRLQVDYGEAMFPPQNKCDN